MGLGDRAPPTDHDLATGVRALADGEPTRARSALALLVAMAPDAPWFHRIRAVDGLLVLAVAAGDDLAARRRALDAAGAQLARIGAAAAPPILALRATAIDDLTR